MARILGLGLAAMLGSWLAAEAQPTTAPSWELRDGGRWQRVDEPAAPPVSDETLDNVEQMIQANQGRAAKRLVVAWLKLHRSSPIWDRGLYLLGQANFTAGDRIMAFYNFDELLDKYPGSRYFYPALERQYEIADAFLRGYKREFLGLKILDAKSEAIEMLYRIQQRAPGSPIAEKSLLRTADYYYSRADYDLAADAYAAYVRSYPRSPDLQRVRLKQAFAALAQFRGVKFDATPVIDARQQLVDLASEYPRLAEEENIPAILARIDEALARKLYETADYYRRTNKPTAAAYYYQYLIRTYPNFPEAQKAQQALSRLPGWVLQQASAPAPETQPATGPAGGGASSFAPESR